MNAKKFMEYGHRKIRVLHLIESPFVAGAEKVALTAAHLLDSEVFDVMLGVPAYYSLGKTVKNEKVSSVIEEASKLRIPARQIPIKSSYSPTQIIEFYRLIKEYQPDVIHTHGNKTNILGFIIALVLRKPIVSTLHGLYKSGNFKSDLMDSISNRILKFFTRTIVVSNPLRSTLESIIGKSKRIITLKNVPPVNEDNPQSGKNTSFRAQLLIPEDHKLIGFVGRLETVKNPTDFIKAASTVAGELDKTHFVIVGEGSQENELKKLVHNLGISDRVTFAGFRSDPIHVFKSLDIYVISSLSEGTPLTLLEAMEQGAAIISTQVGGVPEVIQSGHNGILTEAGNPASLADAIIHCLTDDNSTAQRTKAALETIRSEYSRDTWINTIQETYRDILQKNLK